MISVGAIGLKDLICCRCKEVVEFHVVHSLISLLFEGVAGFQCLVLLFYSLFMTYHSGFD